MAELKALATMLQVRAKGRLYLLSVAGWVGGKEEEEEEEEEEQDYSVDCYVEGTTLCVSGHDSTKASVVWRGNDKTNPSVETATRGRPIFLVEKDQKNRTKYHSVSPVRHSWGFFPPRAPPLSAPCSARSSPGRACSPSA